MRKCNCMSTNIKAYEVTSITGIDGIRGTEVRKPAPGPGQVHIRVRAASLNYRDLMVINGLYGEVRPPGKRNRRDAYSTLAAGAGRDALPRDPRQHVRWSCPVYPSPIVTALGRVRRRTSGTPLWTCGAGRVYDRRRYTRA